MTALAMRQAGLKPAAKIVLYWLADHHNERTGECFPSIARLTELCEMSRRSVEAHLADLEASGLIERRQRHRPEGGKTSNAYILRMTESDAQNLRMGSAKSAHGGCAKSAHDITLEDTNLVNEPCLALVAPLSKPPDLFLEFWERYPRKVKKPEARKAYQRALKKITHDDLMFALSERLPTLEATEKKYRPYPATWLNNEGWEDDIETDHNRNKASQGRQNRPDAALEQIARLAGLGKA